MSDRAPLTVELFSFPDEHRDEIGDLLAEHYLTDDEADTIENGTAPAIVAMHTYSDDEVCLGYDFTIAEQLHKWGCLAAVSQDAKYEYDGMTYLVVPGLDLWSSTGSQGGAVLIEADRIDAVVDAAEHDAAHLVAALDRMTGRPWREAIRAARAERDRLDVEARSNG